MKKPVNKFAVLLWVLAAVALIGEAGSAVATWENMQGLLHEAGESYLAIAAVWSAVRSAILYTGLLAASGVIIELIDQIRWIEKSKDAP
jgi:hypothetical protein